MSNAVIDAYKGAQSAARSMRMQYSDVEDIAQSAALALLTYLAKGKTVRNANGFGRMGARISALKLGRSRMEYVGGMRELDKLEKGWTL